jgi:cellulose synthase/poly-beta-1,6-N-acetylglucosamine synthase-like glycosyltransferase
MKKVGPGSRNGTTDNTCPLISIAMCTYNGEAYLSDQLASILNQTRQPDELVVCDDASTDNTLQVLNQFTKEASFPVRVYRNEQKLGATKNFEKAISLCTGDFIFLSDQDDVWMPEKVNKLRQALMNNPDAGYVFSDALIVNTVLRPMGYTMWQSIKFTRRQRRNFEQRKQLAVLLNHNVVTGATMAFRARLKSVILPIPEEAIHDEWIAWLASSLGMYGVFIEEPLIHYRQHTQQLISGRRVSFAEQVKRAWFTADQSFESLLHREEVKCSKALERLTITDQLERDIQQLFDSKIQHFRVRQSIHEHPHYARFFAVSREFLSLRYHRFSIGWKSAARDLLL